jgi:murein DD-endopeptidase MepM/ murein hydrolase activator NlpD
VNRGRTSRLWALALIALVAPLAGFGASAGADTDDEAAQRAAREIAAAREQANAAAAEYFAAQSELEQLADQAEQLAAENSQLQQQVESLRAQVEQVAVNRFVASGTSGIPLLTGYQQPSDQLQADVLVDLVTESSADAMDEYDLAQSELEANQREVAANQAVLEDKKEEFLDLQAAAEAEVVRLEEVEAKRLEDERIREALEAQQREEQRRREAEAAAAAEAQRIAAEAAAAESSRASAEAAAAAASRPAASSGPAPVAAIAASSGEQSAAAPAPEAASSEDTPAVAPAPAPSGGIICPVAGSSAYSDTYGAARSGGRSHQGVDLIARTGTPLVAVVSGSVQFKQNSLGGNAVWLAGDDGNRYYYAHLSSFEGSSRGVSQGEVIGYVGDTGNASGTPHLHFEVHPGGGAAVNPYPWVVNAGC